MLDPKIEHIYYLSPSAKGLHPDSNNSFFEFFFLCKEMAVARSIFTLDGGFQLFYTAVDMPVTGVPFKVALGYKKMVFGHFKKIIDKQSLDIHLVIII